MTFTSSEIDIMREALAMAASRHESQARSLIGGYAAGEHDRKAAAMRKLRVRLGEQLVAIARRA